jgi:glycosyltransferase involved in cell wall biosynthesis
VEVLGCIALFGIFAAARTSARDMHCYRARPGGRTVKILHLTDLFSPSIGGMESHVLNVVRERHRRGLEIAVITLSKVGPPSSRIEDTGYLVHRIDAGFTRFKRAWKSAGKPYHPPFPDPVVARKVKRIIERDPPDLVYAHNWMIYSYLAFKKPEHPPVIWMQHDYSLVCPKKTLFYFRGDGICPGPSLQRCLQCSAPQYGWPKGTAVSLGLRGSNALLLDRVDRVASASQAAATVAEENVLSPHSVEMVGTFIDPVNEEPSDILRPSYLPRQDGYILFVGALGRHKGIYELLSAYRMLGAGAPPLVFLGTPQRDTPTDWPPGVIIQENVPHAEVMAAWKHCGFGVVPSLWAEPFGRVAVEAGAMGKAVIASKTGGLAELVQHEATGLLVPPGDTGALATAMNRLLADPAFASTLGAAGRKRAELFTLGPFVTRLDAIGSTVIEEHHARHPRG